MNPREHSPLPSRRNRRGLIVSFDIARDHDLSPSFAVAGLLAHARARPDYGRRFELLHTSVPLDGRHTPDPERIADSVAAEHDLRRVDLIALSAYVWSEAVLAPLMRELRARGFRGPFALGGYQITRAEPGLAERYPDARYLIEGPGEVQLLRALLERPPERVLAGGIEPSSLVSPYLSGVIEVPHRAAMVRMETRRGCPWQCSFCAHRLVGETQLVALPMQRVRAELELLAAREVGKINVVDPDFNGRRACLDILRTMVDLGIGSRISVQTRPEKLVRSRWGGEFLDLCEQLDICLEFGLQTAIQTESDAVSRRNDLAAVSQALYEVSRRGIAHEVSLIYGLPTQTVESFAQSIAFVQRHGVETIHAFPLMLTHGTELSRNRALHGLRDEELDEFGIRYVVSSDSFTVADWEEMRRMADSVSRSESSARRPSPTAVTVDPARRSGQC